MEQGGRRWAGGDGPSHVKDDYLLVVVVAVVGFLFGAVVLFGALAFVGFAGGLTVVAGGFVAGAILEFIAAGTIAPVPCCCAVRC